MTAGPRVPEHVPETSFNIRDLGVSFTAACPSCSRLVRWIARPSRPFPIPQCHRCGLNDDGAE